VLPLDSGMRLTAGPRGTPGLAVYTEGDEPEWRSPAHGSKTGPALWP